MPQGRSNGCSSDQQVLLAFLVELLLGGVSQYFVSLTDELEPQLHQALGVLRVDTAVRMALLRHSSGLP